MSPGYVYFIVPRDYLARPASDSIVKIGYTGGSPRVRLASFQTGSPLPLELWAFIEGDEALEHALHETFAALRSHGEWFFTLGKLSDFLCYLTDDSEVGGLVSKLRIEVAIQDCLLQKHISHPSHDQNLWEISADPDRLRPFFPGAFE